MARACQFAKLNRAPKFSVRVRNRCKVCGRARGYYRKFAEIVLGFRFRPARGPDGQPVAVVFPMEFTLPTQ